VKTTWSGEFVTEVVPTAVRVAESMTVTVLSFWLTAKA
jgi:hypothetical protein